MARKKTTQHPDGSLSGQIGIRDPFQLVRHLARSQSDPRKAVAELVQNALDEQATRVVIERRRETRETVLCILDNGLGVLPHLARKDALESIARNIGSSRKRQLTFDERMRKAMLGQYGIGLLGFWSVGHELRMLSQVDGSETWCLTLHEDSPVFEVERVPTPLGRSGTWTELEVHRLHTTAMHASSGTRLESYLAAELRGQLLKHGTTLEIIDRLSRNPRDRHRWVKPRELSGERLEGLERVTVPGFALPIELSLFYAGDAEEEDARVRLECGGSVVLDRLSENPDFDFPPWNAPRLAGSIDFPHLEVSPASRRGFVPNAAAEALRKTLSEVAPSVIEKLQARAEADAARLLTDVHRKLARIFARATELVPHLEWFGIAPQGRVTGQLGSPAADGSVISDPTQAAEVVENAPELFPPGPLAQARLRPGRLMLALGHERELRAQGLDSGGRLIGEGLLAQWETEGPVGVEMLSGTQPRVTVRSAGDTPGVGAVSVRLRQGERFAEARAEVEIVQELPDTRRADAGIPQPEEVNEPLATWRSRLEGGRWQVNVGHKDYRALSAENRSRLRYLATLLAKEVVSHNFPRPELGGILEEMVGVLAALERTGAWSRPG